MGHQRPRSHPIESSRTPSASEVPAHWASCFRWISVVFSRDKMGHIGKILEHLRFQWWIPSMVMEILQDHLYRPKSITYPIPSGNLTTILKLLKPWPFSSLIYLLHTVFFCPWLCKRLPGWVSGILRDNGYPDWGMVIIPAGIDTTNVPISMWMAINHGHFIDDL